MDLIPKEIMSDLYLRFKEDLKDLDNIFANIEIMYWFYLDQFFVIGNLPNVDLIEFTTQFFNQFQNVIPQNFIWDKEFDNWKERKSKTPTASAIIIGDNFEMVLMVKGFRSKRWTFPGGKKETESFKQCAIREVDEEIGYDISDKIDDDLCIIVERNGVMRYHYIICGVSLQTSFRPKTNFEIEKITWFPLTHLPETRLDNCLGTINAHAKDFAAAMHVIQIMKKWVSLVVKEQQDMKVAIRQVMQDDAKSSNPQPTSFTDNQNKLDSKQAAGGRHVNKTRYGMLIVPTKNRGFSWQSLWAGVRLDVDEVFLDLSRQLARH